MTEGQRVTATASLDATGGADPDQNITPSDFTATDGTVLGTSDTVIVTGYIHENDATFNRIGDPDADSTFEINVAIESRTGAGERTDVTHVLTDVAGIEAVNDAGSAQEVTFTGVRVDAAKVFVEQNDAVADAGEVTRTTGARGQEETIYELVMSTDANLARRSDANDDGTFETDATVDSFTGAQVRRELMLPMKDTSGRTNPEMETALVNDSGGTGDYMIAGSIGVSL